MKDRTRCQKMECSTSIISALGKRARETLADERRKRKTIQVLNDTIARQLPLPVDSSAPTSSKRRPASSTSQKTIPVPNTSTINPEAPSGSRVVRLYIYADRKVEDISLVTPDVIYKFFLGLEEELEKIFVLLPYPLLVTPLDEDPTAMSMQKGCSWLRTFVQFTSSTVADLAVQRSGEAVSWRTSSSSSSLATLHAAGGGPAPAITCARRSSSSSLSVTMWAVLASIRNMAGATTLLPRVSVPSVARAPDDAADGQLE